MNDVSRALILALSNSPPINSDLFVACQAAIDEIERLSIALIVQHPTQKIVDCDRQAHNHSREF